MLSHLPNFIPLFFILTTLLTCYFFHRILHKTPLPSISQQKIFGLFFLWLALLSLLSLSGFIRANNMEMPPRFLLAIIPPLLLIIFLFNSKTGKAFIDQLSLADLTLLSVVRIPVEMVLFWLVAQKAIPELMSFTGRNFDILAGLSAPLIYYYGFRKGQIGRKGILIWNIASLLLLLNIVGHAALSIPSPFQQLALDQPNIAVLYFPFLWLPGFIVPIVLFTHLVSLRQLLQNKRLT